MNHQECIFKKYLTSCSVDKVFADRDLTGIRKQKVIDASIQGEDKLYTHISMMFHLHIISFASQLIPLKRKLNVAKREESSQICQDPEPSKLRRLVLVYFEKKQNKQKQLLRAVLIVKVFCKLFLLIYMLENF